MSVPFLVSIDMLQASKVLPRGVGTRNTWKVLSEGTLLRGGCCDRPKLLLTSLPAATSHIAKLGKILPAMRETWVRSPGQEDPLEKGMATHSSILAWRIPWTEEPGGLQPMGS